jgi:hypothetical protein
MPKIMDLTGKEFGRLKPLRIIGRTKQRSPIWLCECECGEIKEVPCKDLISGNTQSCGCLKLEMLQKRSFIHGQAVRGAVSKEWYSWWMAQERCTNPQNKSYHRYGGRGVKFCDRWANNFDNFYSDMGKKPSGKYTLGRKDNDKDYEPDNCRWETDLEQQNNKSSNVFIEYNGVRLTISQWSEKLGIDYFKFYHLIRTRGKDISHVILKYGLNSNIKHSFGFTG